MLNHSLKSACAQTRPLADQPHFMILFVLVLDLSKIREEAERRKQQKQESTKEDNENEVKSGIIYSVSHIFGWYIPLFVWKFQCLVILWKFTMNFIGEL